MSETKLDATVGANFGSIVVPNIFKHLRAGLKVDSDDNTPMASAFRSIFIQRTADGKCYMASTGGKTLRVVHWCETPPDGAPPYPFKPLRFLIDSATSDICKDRSGSNEVAEITLLSEPSEITPAQVTISGPRNSATKHYDIITDHDVLSVWDTSSTSKTPMWFSVLPTQNTYDYSYKAPHHMTVNPKYLYESSRFFVSLYKHFGIHYNESVVVGVPRKETGATLHLSETLNADDDRFASIIVSVIVVGIDDTAEDGVIVHLPRELPNPSPDTQESQTTTPSPAVGGGSTGDTP